MPSQLMGDMRKQAELKAQKEKGKVSRRGVVTFEWRLFSNPARQDGLELEHWVKCFRDAAGRVTPADTGEYSYAKYNKHVTVLRYDDEEWRHLLSRDPGWSREETDYLLDLAQQLDLRWLVIADRYEVGAGGVEAGQGRAEQGTGVGGMGREPVAAVEWAPLEPVLPACPAPTQYPRLRSLLQYPGGVPRSIEDLKARFYSVARQLLVGREGGPDSVANNTIVRHPFNAQHERERKKGLELLMQRSSEQVCASGGWGATQRGWWWQRWRWCGEGGGLGCGQQACAGAAEVQHSACGAGCVFGRAPNINAVGTHTVPQQPHPEPHALPCRKRRRTRFCSWHSR